MHGKPATPNKHFKYIDVLC